MGNRAFHIKIAKFSVVLTTFLKWGTSKSRFYKEKKLVFGNSVCVYLVIKHIHYLFLDMFFEISQVHHHPSLFVHLLSLGMLGFKVHVMKGYPYNYEAATYCALVVLVVIWCVGSML